MRTPVWVRSTSIMVTVYIGNNVRRNDSGRLLAMNKTLVLTAAFLLTAGSALADANVQQKTQVHFGGFMGGIINVFGGKSTHEGLTSSTVVKGNRKATTTGS